MFRWLGKLFLNEKAKKTRREPPYPEGFLKNYRGECPESIDSSQMKILHEWTLQPFSEFQPPKVRFGYLNRTIILTAQSRVDENDWSGVFLIEEENLEQFIKILKSVINDEWNHCYFTSKSILHAEPDSIIIVLGSQKTGTLLLLENARDVILDGRRPEYPSGLHELDFCGAYLPEFIKILEQIHKTMKER